MILNFYPWIIDIDNEAKVKYSEDSISFETNKNNIQKFKSLLTEKQILFFENLGIEIDNLNVDCHSYNSTEIFETRFLLCGNFVSLPSFQLKNYLDIDFFRSEILEQIKITEVKEKDMFKNQIENMQFSFKHPIMYSDKSIYQKWNCGYICVVVILKNYIKNN